MIIKKILFGFFSADKIFFSIIIKVDLQIFPEMSNPVVIKFSDNKSMLFGLFQKELPKQKRLRLNKKKYHFTKKLTDFTKAKQKKKNPAILLWSLLMWDVNLLSTKTRHQLLRLASMKVSQIKIPAKNWRKK